MWCIILYLLVAVVIGLLTWAVRQWFDPNIPAGYSNPNVLRGIRLFGKIVVAWCNFRCLFGGTTVQHVNGINEFLAKRMKGSIPKDVKDITTTEDTAFDGVDVRVYQRKERGEDLPAIILIHGGGWVHGSLDAYDPICLEILKGLDVVLISIGYRLVDEEKGIQFPIPFQDCFDATKYFITNASRYGSDDRRIAIIGDSAGGNLAAAVSLKLRDENFLPAPKLQILLYPALQCVNLSLPSYQQNKNGLLLIRPDAGKCWSLYTSGTDKFKEDILSNRYVPDHYKDILSATIIDRKYHYAPYRQCSTDSDWAGDLGQFAHIIQDPYCAPLMAESLAGLPEAYVFTAQHDVLRDDGLLYVTRLRDAGVKVTHHHSQIGFHGMISLFSIVPEARSCLQDVIGFIEEHL